MRVLPALFYEVIECAACLGGQIILAAVASKSSDVAPYHFIKLALAFSFSGQRTFSPYVT